jgi:hydrogenase/urease accessory protein HupE
MPVVSLLPSWLALFELVEPRAAHKSSDNRRNTINLGIGHRLLVEDDMAIVGINVFTDYETKSRQSLGQRAPCLRLF